MAYGLKACSCHPLTVENELERTPQRVVLKTRRIGSNDSNRYTFLYQGQNKAIDIWSVGSK